MQIRIGSYVAASFLLENDPNEWHALVLLDSNVQATQFVEMHAQSYCYLRFDDVEQYVSNKLCPSDAAIDQGLRFAEGKDKLLVSCRAGQSRSVAMAYLIACRMQGTSDALKLLNPARHRPNRLIVSIGSALLPVPDALDKFDEWRQQNAHVRLSDHYEEIERELDVLELQGATNRICGNS